MQRTTDHRLLFGSVALLFIGLTVAVAIMPAIDNQGRSAPLPTTSPMTNKERLGETVYIAEGCVACHTQQVRAVEMDRPWGGRPGIPADYAHATRQNPWRNSATLMGTERTGPDLTNIGARQPSVDWHLLHLYDPRATVPASIMPSYPWLFEEKSHAEENDVVVNLPPQLRHGSGVIVATQQALHLVDYLLSRKQSPLPTGMPAPDYRLTARSTEQNRTNAAPAVDGQKLYSRYCEACHQADGKGLPGAFPPLKRSTTVMGNDIELYTRIIIHGVDRMPDYATMPGVGELNNLSAEEIAAIINHERTSWGNNAPRISIEKVQQALEAVKEKR